MKGVATINPLSTTVSWDSTEELCPGPEVIWKAGNVKVFDSESDSWCI